MTFRADYYSIAALSVPSGTATRLDSVVNTAMAREAGLLDEVD